MKKTEIDIETLFKAFLDITAIAQTSCFEYDVDCKIDTVGRKLKKFIADEVGDEMDSITEKVKKISEKLRTESRSAKDENTEYARLIDANDQLPKLKESEALLFARKVTFDFQPILITNAQRKEAYNNIPDDQVQIVEWRKNQFKMTTLHKRFRDLIADGWLVIEGSEQAKVLQLNPEKPTAVVKTRNRN